MIGGIIGAPSGTPIRDRWVTRHEHVLSVPVSMLLSCSAPVSHWGPQLWETEKCVTSYSLRHSPAMNLVRYGADFSVIAFWLGREDVQTTSVYLQADMQIKGRALAD
jgi:Phage integrase family